MNTGLLKNSCRLLVALLWSTAVICACGVLGAQERAQPTTSATTPVSPEPATAAAGNSMVLRTPPALRIGSGDLLQVSVYGAPDFDKQVRVSDSGEISLPLLGGVKVDGLTINAAERLLEKRLNDGAYFNNPQVSIFIKEYATQGISVLGEVQKPGIYPLLGQRNLLDAISAAGGTTPKAGEEVTITHRSEPARPLTVRISSSGLRLEEAANFQVMPGDTIVVSKAGIVYVVGDVHLPGGFIMDKSGFTVLQAIAMAQGTNPTASLNNAKIIRKTTQGPQETKLALKQILSAKAPDVALQPDDILFVPSSAAKSVARRGVEAVLQTATGVAIYRR